MAGTPKSIFLIVGFTEGGWHVRRFERALKKRGYTITHNVSDAHYIVGHSGGCYTVPPLRDDQILMLINPTYWPGRSIGERGRAMAKQIALSIRPGNRPLYHAWKTLHNLYYAVRHYETNLFMARRAPHYQLEESIVHAKTILVRNDGDPWLTPDLSALERLHPHLQIARLPGEHDDCWLQPEPYIRLLEDYAGQVDAR